MSRFLKEGRNVTVPMATLYEIVQRRVDWATQLSSIDPDAVAQNICAEVEKVGLNDPANYATDEEQPAGNERNMVGFLNAIDRQDGVEPFDFSKLPRPKR